MTGCPWRISAATWARICSTVENPVLFLRANPELIEEFEGRGASAEQSPAPGGSTHSEELFVLTHHARGRVRIPTRHA